MNRRISSKINRILHKFKKLDCGIEENHLD